ERLRGDHRCGLVADAHEPPFAARERCLREPRLTLVQPGRDQVAPRRARLERHEVRELVADRGDRSAVAHGFPVNEDQAQIGLEERDGVLGNERRGRAGVAELVDQAGGVARSRREHVDRWLPPQRPPEFALDRGEVQGDLVIQGVQVRVLDPVLRADARARDAERHERDVSDEPLRREAWREGRGRRQWRWLNDQRRLARRGFGGDNGGLGRRWDRRDRWSAALQRKSRREGDDRRAHQSPGAERKIDAPRRSAYCGRKRSTLYWRATSTRRGPCFGSGRVVWTKLPPWIATMRPVTPSRMRSTAMFAKVIATV